MIKTFQGHFQDGRFVSPQPAAIPEYVEVLIVVTGTEPISDILEKSTPQRESAGRNSRLLRVPDPSKSTMLGAWNGEVKIPDDFDEPLKEMKEYMY